MPVQSPPEYLRTPRPRLWPLGGLIFVASIALLMWLGLFAMGSAFFAWLWRMIQLGGF